MYPKVKVREVKDDEEEDYDRFSLDDFESLSLHVSTPVEENNSDLTPMIVWVPVSDITRPDMTILPPIKEEAEKIIKKKDKEETKADIKPNTFLRPRAVLSSPDNDELIGTKNKTKTEVHSGLKSHNSCQKRHVQCKVIPSPIVFGSPLRDLKEASHVKHSCPGTKRTKRSVKAADPKRKKNPLQQHTQTPAI